MFLVKKIIFETNKETCYYFSTYEEAIEFMDEIIMICHKHRIINNYYSIKEYEQFIRVIILGGFTIYYYIYKHDE